MWVERGNIGTNFSVDFESSNILQRAHGHTLQSRHNVTSMTKADFSLALTLLLLYCYSSK